MTALKSICVFPSSLEEECEASLCSAALTAKNQELQNDMKRVTSVFNKLRNYMNMLALPSMVSLLLFKSEIWLMNKTYLSLILALSVQHVAGVQQDAVPQSSISAVFTQLAACLHSLHDAVKGEPHLWGTWTNHKHCLFKKWNSIC